jgi:hypothetical protein
MVRRRRATFHCTATYKKPTVALAKRAVRAIHRSYPRPHPGFAELQILKGLPGRLSDRRIEKDLSPRAFIKCLL